MSRLRVAYLPASLNPGGAERQMLSLAEPDLASVVKQIYGGALRQPAPAAA